MLETASYCDVDEETLCILQLIRSENIGPKTFLDLIKLFKDAKTALARVPELAKNGGLKRKISLCTKKTAEDEVTKLQKFGGQIITYKSPHYPKLLNTVEDKPIVLSVKGQTALLQKRSFAIVGARHASINACKFSSNIARELGKHGYITVSGLARGIDTYTHQGSIETGTIGVIAGGIDSIYPSENHKLYHELYEKGLVISEYPFSTQPISRNFPQRNRIISGMSQGLLVIEASMSSGSLITAKYAANQGRPVFAIPGFPSDHRCKGTNHLIKNGAKLTESIEDILEELASYAWYEEKQPSFLNDNPEIEFIQYEDTKNNLEKARNTVIGKLSCSPVSFDDIVHTTNLPSYILQIVLLEYELAGKVIRSIGNKYSLLTDN